MIPFSPPRYDEKLSEAVTEVLKSGWITTGPKTKLFEKKINEFTGAKRTICLGSATAGMELSLRWFGVGEGDEVIVPAYTYCATANVVSHCGAKMVLVDVGSDFNINIDEIKKAITDKTKAIMPVDIAGFPCNYDEIMELVNTSQSRELFNAKTPEQEKLGRMLVLSDSAHSFGAKYKNRVSGSLADISVFSFHAVKNLSTAEGGCVCLNLEEPFDCDEIYNELCIKSLHGQNKDALSKTKLGNWKYDVVEPGYKCNMTDLQAALGLVELDRYKSETLKRRREIFIQYTNAFSQKDWAQLASFETEEKISSYHLFPLRIKKVSESKRDQIIQSIFKRQVAVNVHFPPIPLLSYYKNLGYQMSDYPIAYDNYSREISLPVYYDLDESKADTVIQAVIEAVEENL